MQGFNLDVSPKQNWFKKFMGNGGEQNPWEIYVQSNNIKSSDDRTKITITHPKNIIDSAVDIDTRGIKTNIDNSLWEVDKDNINFVKLKDDKGIIANNKRIIDVGTPTFLSDATTKVYIDNLLDKKQDKLIAGENIKIDKESNTISATGGSADLSDYYKKEEVDKKLDDTKAMFTIAFQINAVSKEIPNLETTDKTVAGAINELNKKQPTPSIPQWKEVGTKVNINHIKYNFKANTKYKIYYNFESQKSIKKFNFICKEFLYGELNTDVQTLDWDKVNDRIMVSLQMQNDTIAIVSDLVKYGQLLKLEELQE